ncbi:MAG: glutamyl-tRNA reductase, partial [Chloroflexota bacterium]
VLSTLFRQAIVVGKRARTETAISRNAASVSFAAVELARKIFGGANPNQVLIIGAGEMGELTAKTLLDCGARAVIVANRTRRRAEEIAARFGGRVLDFAHLDEGLRLADVVISSTGAPHYILRPGQVRQAMAQREGRPLFFIDIAVPRDIDPDVGKIDGVFLYDVDDLNAVVEANLRERAQELAKVEAIIAEETDRFGAWLSSLDAVPTISALRAYAEQIRQAEVARAAGRLRHLSPQDWDVLNAMTTSIINKLLHQPIQHLKASTAEPGNGHVEIVQDLFGLAEKR